MANVGWATLSVVPSAQGFGKALSDDVDPQLDDAGQSSGSKFGKILGTAAVAAAGIAMAGIAIVAKTGWEGVLESSAAQAQLTAGLESTGRAANVTLGEMNAYADSLERTTGQDADMIAHGQSLLLTFTNIKNVGMDKIFDDATLSASNMAAKMGGDTSSSAILLGKALNDPVKGISALTRVGVSFTEGQKKQIEAMVEAGDTVGAQKLILAELTTEFGGAAVAAGESLPGQLLIGQRAFEKMSESIVSVFIPVVLPAIKAVTDWLTEHTPEIQAFAQRFVDGIKNIYATFQESGALEAFKEVLGGVIDKISEWWAKINESGALDRFITTMKDMGAEVWKFVSGAASSLVPILKKAGDGFKWIADHGELVGPIIVTLVAAFLAYKAVLAAGFAIQLAALPMEAARTASIFASALANRSLASAMLATNTAGTAGIAVDTGMTVSVLRSTAAKIGSKIATVATTVATGAATAAQWLFNAALSANPIGIVIIAVAALVAGLVWFFTKTEVGQKAWDAFTGAMVTAWNWLWEESIKPGLDAMGAAWTWLWDNILAPLIEIWKIEFAAIGAVITWLWENVTKPILDFIAAAWNWLWANVVQPVIALIKAEIYVLGAVFSWLYDSAIKPNADKAKTVFEGLKTAFGEVHDFFSEKVTAIKGFFSGIAETIKGSFKGAFNGIAGFWNRTVGQISFTVPDLIGVPNRGESWSMPRMPILDTGGIVTGPTLAMLAANSRPEVVIPLDKLDSIGAGGVTNSDLDRLAEKIVAGMIAGSVRITAAGFDQSARRADLDAHAGLGTVVG